MTRLLAAFVLLMGGFAPGPAWAARLIASPHGDSAWLLDAQGAISRVNLRDGSATAWGLPEDSAGRPPAADIALASDGATLFTLVPAADGRTTQLRALDTASGRERSRWDVRGQGRFMVVTTDGARACIVGLKPSGPGHRAGKPASSDDDWTLTVVELATGKQTPPVSPGLTPLAVALMEAPGGGPKILLAASDRVATYSFEPLRVSWFYKSPGENNDVAVPPGSSVVCLLRGSSLAVIDPGRRPTERGRVQLGEDDATTVVALPARGRALAVSGDGRLAAVLHDDAASITWVDLAGGKVVSTESLDHPHDLVASRLLGDGGEDKRTLAMASSADPGGAVATRQMDAPPPAIIEKFELKVIVPEPPKAGPVSIPPEQLKAPPGDPTPRDTSPRDQPSPAAKPPVATPPAATPPATAPPSTPPAAEPMEADPLLLIAPAQVPAPVLAPRPAAGETLKGRLTGDFTQAREVLFYGPGNIIKLHSRAKVEADGTFSLPLPPPGSYRVVVSAGPGAHIFTRPEFRSLTVTVEAGGLEGIDFEVRGAIK